MDKIDVIIYHLKEMEFIKIHHIKDLTFKGLDAENNNAPCTIMLSDNGCGGFSIEYKYDESTIENWIQCDSDIEIPVGPREIVFVNIYSITRHYGGPEEGGWWYNWDSCIESVPVAYENSELMKEEMFKQYHHIKHGNIYSVLGGTDLDVRIERKPKESETRRTPHYE